MLRSAAAQLLYQFAKPYKSLAGWAIACSFLVSGLEVISAVLVMPLIQILNGNVLEMGASSSVWVRPLIGLYAKVSQPWQLLAVAGTLLLVTALKNTSRYFTDIYSNKFQLRAGSALRQQCVERFLELELSFYNRANLGELLSYVNEQAKRGEQLFGHLLEIISDGLVTIALCLFLFLLSPSLTLVTILNLGIVILLLRFVVNAVQRNGRKAAKSLEAFSGFVTEMLTGLRVVQSFGAEPREGRQSSQLLDARYRSEFAAFKFNSAVVPVTETAGITLLLVLVVAGAGISGSGSLPFLLTYVMALLRILPRINHLNSIRSQFALLSSSLEMIQRFLNSTEVDRLPDGNQIFSGLRDRLTLKSLNFTFPGNTEPTLKDVNLVVRRGETVALVGSSGSGKSTMVDLLMRFYDPDLGGILVDGVDLRQFQRRSWRLRIAMVSQDTFLFNTTVRENIAYSKPDSTDAEVIAAAKQAYADEFIQDFPQGYETVVGNRGAQLSGGQRQRIAIARAILRNPDILILDEATSALDTQSERIVQKALEAVSRDRTVIVIAHRLSTVRNADTIVVLQQGQIAEQGTHQELMTRQSHYWRLSQAQGTSNTLLVS
jgi:ATP-binding cassette, subfamily B, bacterial MsbA